MLECDEDGGGNGDKTEEESNYSDHVANHDTATDLLLCR